MAGQSIAAGEEMSTQYSESVIEEGSDTAMFSLVPRSYESD
jgi:hypothetical protein